jgi:hypothetical protein
VGVDGLVYSGSFLIGQRHKKNYYGPQDRIVYSILPSAAYGLHVLGGVWFCQYPQRGLTLVATGMLSLLALAICNAWVIVVDVVSHSRGQQQSNRSMQLLENYTRGFVGANDLDITSRFYQALLGGKETHTCGRLLTKTFRTYHFRLSGRPPAIRGDTHHHSSRGFGAGDCYSSGTWSIRLTMETFQNEE